MLTTEAGAQGDPRLDKKALIASIIASALAAAVLAAASTPNPATLILHEPQGPATSVSYYHTTPASNTLIVDIGPMPSDFRGFTVDIYGFTPDAKIVHLGHYRSQPKSTIIAAPLLPVEIYAEKWFGKEPGLEPPLLILINIFRGDKLYVLPRSVTLNTEAIEAKGANYLEIRIGDAKAFTERTEAVDVKELATKHKTVEETGWSDQFPPPRIPPSQPPYSYYPDLEWVLETYTEPTEKMLPILILNVHGDIKTYHQISDLLSVNTTSSDSASVVIGITGYVFKTSRGNIAVPLSIDFAGFVVRTQKKSWIDIETSFDGVSSLMGLPPYTTVTIWTSRGYAKDYEFTSPRVASTSRTYLLAAGIKALVTLAEYRLYDVYTWTPYDIYFNTTLIKPITEHGGGDSVPLVGWAQLSTGGYSVASSYLEYVRSSGKAEMLPPAGHHFSRTRKYFYFADRRISIGIPIKTFNLGNMVVTLGASFSVESSTTETQIARVNVNLGPRYADGRCHTWPRLYVSKTSYQYGGDKVELEYYYYDVYVSDSGSGYCG